MSFEGCYFLENMFAARDSNPENPNTRQKRYSVLSLSNRSDCLYHSVFLNKIGVPCFKKMAHVLFM
jgi:hypothetical protein